MSYTIAHIAETLNGTPDKPSEGILIKRLARIEDATEGTVTFLANMKYLDYIYTTGASLVVVEAEFVPEKPVKPVLLRVNNAYEAFSRLTEMFQKSRVKSGISATAVVHESAVLGEGVYLGDYTVVGENVSIGAGTQVYAHVFVGDNVQIGSKTVVYPGVRIYDDCVVGNHCKLHAGVVIGADGFGFAPQADNTYSKVQQLGNVILEDHVEVGANTTIDRATIGSTILRKGVKIDNLIQIAHNVEIGENTVIAAQTGISGSTKIGRNCMIGGQVGIVGHLVIGDNVKIAAQSGVGSNIKDGVTVQGSPAFDIGEYRRAYVCFRNLPKHIAALNKLESAAQTAIEKDKNAQ